MDGITSHSSTIKAIESIKRDAAGGNDGWARCPRCRITISKGSGCDHMTCVCGNNFSWGDALRKKKEGPVVKGARIERLEFPPLQHG